MRKRREKEKGIRSPVIFFENAVDPGIEIRTSDEARERDSVTDNLLCKFPRPRLAWLRSQSRLRPCERPLDVLTLELQGFKWPKYPPK
jgi:hypothetical protein